MTKEEWRLHWRNLRVSRPTPALRRLSSQLILEALKAYYDYDWTPEQEAFIRLVDRYKDRLPPRYQAQIELWRPEAKARSQEIWREMFTSENAFLTSLPKDGSWVGGTLLLEE